MKVVLNCLPYELLATIFQYLGEEDSVMLALTFGRLLRIRISLDPDSRPLVLREIDTRLRPSKSIHLRKMLAQKGGRRSECRYCGLSVLTGTISQVFWDKFWAAFKSDKVIHQPGEAIWKQVVTRWIKNEDSEATMCPLSAINVFFTKY